jgi:thiosulfate/3-mercaptopyruvate sulfurtransferase
VSTPTAASSPLVTVDWLALHLGQPEIVVADVRWYLQGKRGIDAYRQGHIPAACFADVDRDLASLPGPGRPGRHPLPDADAFAEFLARIGVGPDDLVVAYDDSGGSTAARLWWLLRYFGHDGGRVLDGGLLAWAEGGHPLDTREPARPRAARMRLVPRREMVVDKATVVGRVLVSQPASSAIPLLLDARAPERFEGSIEPVDARPGHIPGAKSAPFVQNLAAPAGRFRSPPELASRYASLGVASPGEVVSVQPTAGAATVGGAAQAPAVGPAADRVAPVIAYCGSGVTACHDLLALSLIGRPDALLYEGSWSDWAADLALPAALGKG